MTGLSEVDEAATHLSSDAVSARGARRFVARTLASWGLRELEEVACLLVSELVANVVLHAGTDLDVCLRRAGGKVRVEVRDESARLPDRREYSLTSATGRGLLLVDQLATDWGVEAAPPGKVVWFELDEPAGSADAPIAGAL